MSIPLHSVFRLKNQAHVRHGNDGAPDVTRINAFVAPLPFIPPEVLCHIFLVLSWSDPPRKSQRRIGFDLGWIVITHVCRLWRQVALDDASIWSRIDFDALSDKWLAEIISRLGSSRAPLYITLSNLSRGPPSFANLSSEREEILLSQDNVPRLRSLTITIPRHQDLLQRLLQFMTFTPAVGLEMLHITRSNQLFVPPSNTPIPFDLPADSVPQLKSLYLIGYPLNWLAPHLSNLTHLMFTVELNDTASGHVTEEAIYAALARMMKLQSLVFRVPSANSADTGEHITMPSLVSLQLMGEHEDCVNMADRLILPLLGTLQIIEDSVTTLEGVIHPVPFHPSPSNTPQLQSLFLHQFSLNWSAPLLSNLVHLEVSLSRQPSMPSSYVPSPRVLLETLMRMGRLERLALRYTVPRISAYTSKVQSSGPDADITLSSLRQLNLNGMDCVGLVNRLVLPSLQFLEMIQDQIPSEPVVPFRPCNSRMPRLNSLQLHSCALDWNASAIAGLVHLTVIQAIDGNTISGGSIQDFRTFSQSLGQMTRLETLDLWRGLPRVSFSDKGEPLQENEDISLPSLRSLFLMGPAEDCANLANHIYTPPSARRVMYMYTSARLHSEEPGHTGYFHFRQLCNSMPIPRALALAFHDDQVPQDSILRIWSAPQDWSRPYPDTVDDADLTVRLASTRITIPEVHAWDSLRLEHLEALSLDSPGEKWAPSLWKQVLGRAGGAKLLHLRGGASASTSLVQALLPSPGLPGDGLADHLLFPALEELQIYSLGIAKPRTTDTAFSEALCACMEARRDIGHPIHKVRLTVDPPGPSWVDRLRASVANVQLMGRVQGRRTPYDNFPYL